MRKMIIRNGQRVEEIISDLTEEILNGPPILPGERIGEKDLADTFGTAEDRFVKRFRSWKSGLDLYYSQCGCKVYRLHTFQII